MYINHTPIDMKRFVLMRSNQTLPTGGRILELQGGATDLSKEKGSLKINISGSITRFPVSFETSFVRGRWGEEEGG